jgi:hypothetical protein
VKLERGQRAADLGTKKAHPMVPPGRGVQSTVRTQPHAADAGDGQIERALDAQVRGRRVDGKAAQRGVGRAAEATREIAERVKTEDWCWKKKSRYGKWA